MRLLNSNAKIETGRISFLGKDLVRLPERQMQSIRGAEISMIFQEPMTSLNPVFTVGAQIMEAIILHQKVTKTDARHKAIELLREVGIPKPEQRIDFYPHQMSGGQKQRVMIAMALSCNPQLLIADEPTTALDVTIQAQILEILRKLRDQRGMAIIFITHDLGVIAEIADDVLVMFQGEEVEYGPVLKIFHHGSIRHIAGCPPWTPSWTLFMKTATPASSKKKWTRPASNIWKRKAVAGCCIRNQNWPRSVTRGKKGITRLKRKQSPKARNRC
jgi:peptide/nickel transport system ATP-binding protein